MLVRGDRAHAGATAGLHQEEHLPGGHAEGVQQHRDPGQPRHVGRHDGCVHLYIQAGCQQRADRRQGVVEMPGDAADPVMDVCRGTVQADRDRPYPGTRDPGDHLRAEGGGHRRRQRDRDAGGLCVADQVEQVRPQQAVTTGEDQDRVRPAEPGHLVDQLAAFLRAELTGQRPPLCGRPAVTAGEPARPGRLPEDQHGTAGEVGVRPGSGAGHASPLGGPAGGPAGRRQAPGPSVTIPAGPASRAGPKVPPAVPRPPRWLPGQARPVRRARRRPGQASAGLPAGHRRRCTAVPVSRGHRRQPRSPGCRR